MKLFRFISYTLTAAFLISAFAGCNVTPSDTTGGDTANQPQTDGNTTSEPATEPSVEITKTDAFSYDFSKKDTLTSTPNLLAGGYMGELSLVESFDGTAAEFNGDFTATDEDKKKTEGDGSVCLKAAGISPEKAVYSSYTFKAPLNLADKPVISFDINCKPIASGISVYVGAILYGNGQSYTCVSKVQPANTFVTYTYNITSCPFRDKIERIEFCESYIDDSDKARSVTLYADNLKAGVLYDNIGTISCQQSFYTAENCALTSAENALCMKLNGKGSITSPTFQNSSVSRYDMLMPLRNTVLVVLKNKSTATRLTLSYTTSENRQFTADGSKTLDITASDNYTAYYFNLSDTKNCSGRLSSFRLEADGEGDILIAQMSFEQEKPIEELYGSVISCKADAGTAKITVNGIIDADKYDRVKDLSIKICETTMGDESDSVTGKTVLCTLPISSLKADKDGNYPFTCEFGLFSGKTTRISSQFLPLIVSGDTSFKIGNRFYVDNFRDFGTNPYHFDLPETSVTVSQFGAKGDSFTNDTAAIQAAIDAVSAAGGGSVILEGDDSFYGRRYIATNIRLKDNVNLVIEHGAMIWQSQRPTDYAYAPAFGHDAVMPGINWTHNMHVSNLPLVQFYSVNNVKLTGGGAVRALDLGSEDNAFMPGYSDCCEYKIHVVPVGVYDVKKLEISDIDILRSNNYHLPTYHSTDLYYSNIKMHEVKCVSGDGIGLGMGTKNVYIDRCFLQSNDDGVAFWTCYDDPRGILWWHSHPGEDNCIENIEVYRSYIYSGGGKAIAFITWGTSDSDLSREEVKNITVCDNVLVSVNPVGTWPDNPYKGGAFTNTATDDYSPVKDVYIMNNRYSGTNTLGPIQATNFVTDCGILSASDFQNGDFSQKLVNWTVFAPDDSLVTSDGKTGKLTASGKGEVFLCEGLYLVAGDYEFSAAASVDGGKAVLTIKSYAGDVVASKEISGPADYKLSFTATAKGVYYIGLSMPAASSGSSTLDNCSLKLIKASEIVKTATFSENFDGDLLDVWENASVWSLDSGREGYGFRCDSRGGLNSLVTSYNTYTDVSISADVRFNSWATSLGDNNFGIILRADKDETQFVFVEYTDIAGQLHIREFTSAAPGGRMIVNIPLKLDIDTWYDFSVSLAEDKIIVSINGKELVNKSGITVKAGTVRLNAYFVDCTVDNVEVTEVK